MQDRHYLVIPRRKRSHVLLLSGQEGWELPSVQSAPAQEDWRWRNVRGVSRAMQERLGLRAAALHYLSVSYLTAGDPLTGVLVMENLEVDWMPPAQAHWVGREEIQRQSFALSEHRALVDGWFAEVETGEIPTLRKPWMCPGWFSRAADWIQARLAEQSIQTIGPIEPVRSWFLSCLLRVSTDNGAVWFKASPPWNRYEPPLTQALAHDYPDLLPTVLGVDIPNRWLLLREADGVRLNRHPDRFRYLPRWEHLLRTVARIQREDAGRLDTLLGYGCPDWRPATLHAQADSFLAELWAYLLRIGACPDIALEALPDLAARLKRLCKALDAYGIPAAFVHWDLHSPNILADATTCRVIDWTGGIAHPFSVLSTVFEEHSDPVVQQRLRDIYLEAWADVASPERLRKACRLALTLAAFQNLMGTFAQATQTETPWEQAVDRESLLWYLRHLAERL